MVHLRKRKDIRMRYEYNGNLLEEDRVLLITNEIMEKYPEINFLIAQIAARLEGYISDKVTTDDKLKRLYNIMLLIRDNKNLTLKIYQDYLNIVKVEQNSIKNNKYITMVDALNDYIQGYCQFPFMNNIE